MIVLANDEWVREIYCMHKNVALRSLKLAIADWNQMHFCRELNIVICGKLKNCMDCSKPKVWDS